jgi:cytosine deaminase
MQRDLVVRNAPMPDGRTAQDIAIRDGRIAAIRPKLAFSAEAEELDAAGHLVSSPFVDVHFHMDATLSLGLPRLNRSGTPA